MQLWSVHQGRRGRCGGKVIEEYGKLWRRRTVKYDCAGCRADLERDCLPHVIDAELNELCSNCPWRFKESALTAFLVDKLRTMDSGAQLGRYELTDSEWKLMDVIRSERLRLLKEENGSKN